MATAVATKPRTTAATTNAWRAFQGHNPTLHRAVPRPHRADREDLCATALLTDDMTAYPLLSKQEERELALRARAGDSEARERLIVSNMRLVCAVAMRYTASGVEYNDLVSEGFLGLMRGVDHYDPDAGASLSTYAVTWIRQGMGRCLDTQGRPIRYPEHVATMRRRVLRAAKRLYGELGREATRDELAAAVGISVEHVADLLSLPVVGETLDRPAHPNRQGVVTEETIGDLVPDARPTPEQVAESQSATEELLATLRRHLTSREYATITMRYGLAGEHEHTLLAVGKRLKVSRERARQLEMHALGKLRTALGADGMRELMAS